MDGAFIAKHASMYVRAAGLTLRIALVGIGLSLAVGALCCAARRVKVPVLSKLCGAYVELARNTPLLIQLFFLYFGLPRVGVRVSSEACAVIGLTFLGGAYMAEALRSGLDAVDRAQIEAGQCIGLSPAQNMRCVVLPQAVATAIPALWANVIFLIKETSVFSAVALADLMYVAKDLIGMYYKTDEALLMLVVSYLIILLPLSAAGALLEGRLRHAGLGNQRSV